MPLFSRFHVKPLKIKAFLHSRPYSHSIAKVCDTVIADLQTSF
nr:MAG TPA: hypothetical protein [Caudoviricetes sp.]